MTALLGDEDPDVRILAVELVRGMPAAEATRLLCRLLEASSIRMSAPPRVDALAEVGTREALPTLRAVPSDSPARLFCRLR